MGLQDQIGEGLIIMAIGDMNNDKHADIITVNNQQDHFTVHYYNPATMGYEASATWPVDLKSGGQHQIASIVISRDMAEYQQLYIIYYVNGDRSQNPKMKVFSQDVYSDKFVENTDSSLNNLELYKDS